MPLFWTSSKPGRGHRGSCGFPCRPGDSPSRQALWKLCATQPEAVGSAVPDVLAALTAFPEDSEVQKTALAVPETPQTH